MAIHHFFIRKIAWSVVNSNLGLLNVRPVSYIHAAQLACGHSQETLAFPLQSLSSHIPFLMRCSAIILANVSLRSRVIYFLFIADLQDSISFSLSSSPADSHISISPIYTITSDRSDSFPGNPQMSKFSFFS